MFVSQIYDECAEILGTTDQNKVFRKIQQAVQTLLESGHWTHATAEVDVCTGWDGCSLALPRGVDVPLAVNIDGSPTYFRNRLFQYHVNKGGMFNSVDWAWDDRGYVATLMDIIQPSQLVAVAESNNDVGKKIRVLGLDQNNRTLRSQTQNGAGVDGILVPIHSQQDFTYGVIVPDDATIATRDVAITPINTFTTSTPHGLTSGQGMSARVISGTIPVPLSDGQTYYVGVIDAYAIQLFSDSLNAQDLRYPISLSSIAGFGSMELRDKRNASVVTSMEFSTAPSFAIDSPNEVVFPNSPLPAPLESKKTYFAQPIDSTHLNIFSSLSDAQTNTNPIYTTGSVDPIDIDIRKPIVPETKLVFSVKHNFNDGDQVQAVTSGGTLPQPLLENTNYFVNVIDQFSVSLHENKADAENSTATNFINPIKITTSGAGTSSLVKLVQATATTGTQNQITAPSLSIAPASGTGAQFQAVVVGGVVDISITNDGSGYTSTPTVTFSDPPSVDPSFGSLVQRKTAKGFATINTVTNKVSGIVITDPGMGYTEPPTISISPSAVNPTLSVSLLIASGTTATCTTSTPHGLSSGNNIVISGATPSVYNGTFVINVTGPDTFTYTLTSSLGVAKAITSLTSGTISVSSMTTSGTVVTVNTAVNHGFILGNKVFIKGASGTLGSPDGLKTITQIVDANTFRFNDGVSYGTITGTIRTWRPVNQSSPTETSNVYATATSNGHGFNNGEVVYVSGAIPPGLNGKVTVANSATNTFQYEVAPDQDNNSGSATVFQYPATGTVIAQQPSSSQASATCTIQTSLVSHYIQINGGSGYTDPPNVKIEAGTAGGSGATASAIIVGGAITRLVPITTGTGYASIPAVKIEPTTQVYVNFSSTGTLPSPLTSGTTYRAESPSGTTFTVKNTDFSDVNITSLPTGTFYVVISRAFNIDFTNNWLGDFTTLSSGQTIYFGTDFSLPTTTPSIDNGVTPFYLKVISNTLAGAYSDVGLTNIIDVDSFGTGQTYYAVRFQVTPSVDDNLIKPINTAYLSEDQVVQFSTSGILPTPLSPSTDYTIKIIGDSVRVYSGGSPVVLTDTGTGQLSLDIIRSISVQPSTSIVATSSLYETGTQLVARAKDGDTLPTGLVANTNYYVRRLDNNSFELYDTLANARNTPSTTGRFSYTTTGNTSSSTFFVDAIYDPTFVKSIAHIEKPITDGYVSLYAWDYGRSNDMTLIGQYHPTEVNPTYRRIRVGKPCAWARIIYKVTSPSISSVYDFIPLEQERAIIAAVHAVDLEDKDFAEQAARYWQIAYSYLRNQQESIDGHAMAVPQINNVCYGDESDPVMW